MVDHQQGSDITSVASEGIKTAISTAWTQIRLHFYMLRWQYKRVLFRHTVVVGIPVLIGIERLSPLTHFLHMSLLGVIFLITFLGICGWFSHRYFQNEQRRGQAYRSFLVEFTSFIQRLLSQSTVEADETHCRNLVVSILKSITSESSFDEIKTTATVMKLDPISKSLVVWAQSDEEDLSRFSLKLGEGAAGKALALPGIIYVPSIDHVHGVLIQESITSVKNSQKPIFRVKTQKDAFIEKKDSRRGLKCLMAVPMSHCGRDLGVLCFDAPTRNAFRDEMFHWPVAVATSRLIAITMDRLLPRAHTDEIGTLKQSETMPANPGSIH